MRDLSDLIRKIYGRTVRHGLSGREEDVRAIAEAFGYSAQELAAIPAESSMGLSCGNPIALANLEPGEVVVDLGSGGGQDVFLASQKVGPAGKAIGVDLTQEMIDLARRNALSGPEGQPYSNVMFKLGSIDALPLPDAGADVVISNCVINLASDKRAVFGEMFRVLKPGGRIAVSDIALKTDAPPEIARSVAAWVGCLAGAIPIEAYEMGLREAGFDRVTILDAGADLNVYKSIDSKAGCCEADPQGDRAPQPVSCCGPVCEPHVETANEAADEAADEAALESHDFNAFAASVKVLAVKPRSSSGGLPATGRR